MLCYHLLFVQPSSTLAFYFFLFDKVAIAQIVPHLNVIISLIGALCSTALALFIPAIIELVLAYGSEKGGPSGWVLTKNTLVIALAIVGLVTGTLESVNLLISVIGT